jgi:hypothetical protein
MHYLIAIVKNLLFKSHSFDIKILDILNIRMESINYESTEKGKKKKKIKINRKFVSLPLSLYLSLVEESFLMLINIREQKINTYSLYDLHLFYRCLPKLKE